MDACSSAKGGSHSIWHNPKTNEIQAIPRHTELSVVLVQKIWSKVIAAGAVSALSQCKIGAARIRDFSTEPVLSELERLALTERESVIFA